MRYFEIVLFVSFIVVSFYLGYNWALKRNTVATTDIERKAAAKTDIITANARISDVRVETEAKILNKAAKKTDDKKDALETLRDDLKEKSNYPGLQPHPTEFTAQERDAMNEVIQAQGEELKASRALSVELIIARDQWRNAYVAAREENNIQRIAQEARLAAIRGEKIKIGAISLGVGFVAGMLAK
jgi:hypothetical protein